MCPDRVFGFFVYNSKRGCISTWNGDPGYIYTCRDSFFRVWQLEYNPDTGGVKDEFATNISRWIGLAASKHDNPNIQKLAKLWNDVEDMLGLKERTTIHLVEGYETVFVFNLSEFWIRTDTHRSLCTLLIRNFVKHQTKDVFESLKKDDLASKVLVAIKYFLSGNTRPTYPRLSIAYTFGFVDKFKGLDENAVARLLVKPAA